MSYHDQHCVCGSRRKAPDSLLCGDCRAVADPLDLATFDDQRNRTGPRRAAAIRLLAGARRRPRQPLRGRA